MPTIITHSVFAVSLAHVFKHSQLPRRFWLLAIICSILPDIDVIGFSLGIQYGDFWGHRGFTHSLSFALLTSLIVVGLGFYQERFRSLRPRLILFFFLVTASHGLFDALTNGGLGIAFFSPLDTGRYFLPFRPIQVSPIGIHDFLRWGGWRVLESEFKWIALPSILIIFVSVSIRYFVQVKAREPL
ncbi:MAG: metal-dependent hydrolase [Thioalkalispiraceae bacterium]|jgi:inner membrane protein